MKKRLNLILILIGVVCLLLVYRLYYLSIKSNTYYEELSKQNYIKKVYQAPSRGIIKDRNDIALAINDLGFSLSIKPHLRSYKNRHILDELINTIILHFPDFEKEKLIKKYNKLDSPYKHDFVKIIEYIPYEKFFDKYTVFNSLDNLKVESAVKRNYPYKKVAAHILGYVGKASRRDIENNHISKYSGIIGKNGLEKYYNDILQGELGYKEVKVNALNKELEVLKEKEVKINNNIKITIDIELEKYIHDIFNEKAGAIVVMDVKNGEILAAASFPEFDNNVFVNGISYKEWDDLQNNIDKPFTNKITNGMYPPGSVWKMGVALAFLENGINKNFKVNCTGSHEFANRKFRCWKEDGHGTVDFRKAIRESCDDFFYKASQKIGINKISETMKKFGLGQKTGIDQMYEFIGINPNEAWKRRRYNRPWFTGETLISSIGQGSVLVTPIQIARYTAFLATKKLPTPHFYKDAYKEPEEVDIDDENLKLIQRGMYDVANHKNGTAYWHLRGIDSRIKIAAKTGTAQVVRIEQDVKKRALESELEYLKRSHAWLTTYGPYEDPQYSVTILVEHGGHGGSTAGPAVTKIYNKLIELGYIK
ncbi:MAG: penicillin-binding protein 2 [Arcobacter sp.]|uniref:penicillin-binding protein 2 n=1 Tax=uncultured Arcobacter sp. TaxID=165434 RepID=UPI000CBB1188|nr:penicillin-binding protein 2 [uncultured Arcobacter sp.]PLY11218.1 MAG: penicillin-binding protein 2 [Arcobacter sp.]